MAAEVRMGQLTADFGKTAVDYGKHRAGFPSELFDRLAAMVIGRAGARTLDLGTGTGTIARSLAQRGCDSIGLDRSAPLMEEARRMDREAAVTVRYVEAAAEDTGFPEASFDLVIAGQCWFWFDRPRVASEAQRILKPGGHLVIAHFDWIPLPGNVADLTEKLIAMSCRHRVIRIPAPGNILFRSRRGLLARRVARAHSRECGRGCESLAGRRNSIRSRATGAAR